MMASVEAARRDLAEDEERFQHMATEDRRKHLQRARKKRWKNEKGPMAGKELLHARAELSERGAAVLLPMFGSGGRFPMGLGKERAEEMWE